MTPHRDHDRGTLIIDRRFRDVGRIKKASGTTDRSVFKGLNGMLDVLYNMGRLDLLRAIQGGKVGVLSVWATFRLGNLHELPDTHSLQSLNVAWREWVEAYDVSSRYKEDRLRSLRRLGVTKEHTTADVPELLIGYRFRCQRQDHAPAFRQTKAIVLAFLRDTLGRSHRLYERVNDVTLVKRQTPKRKPNPQTPEQARAIREALGKHGDVWWTMCCTGMMPDELWGRKWKDGPNYVHILGTKRIGRDRKVPRLCTPREPLVKHPTAFNAALKAATNGRVQPYDARRTFMFWMEEAGIQRTRRKMYQGHGVKDVTELYERHEVAAFLDSDADLLRQHLGDEKRHLEVVNT